MRSADRHRGRAGGKRDYCVGAAVHTRVEDGRHATPTRPTISGGTTSVVGTDGSIWPPPRFGAQTPSMPQSTTRGVVGLTIPLRSADLDDDVAGSLSLGDRREPRGRLFKVEHGGHIDADCPGCGVTEQVCTVSLTRGANTPNRSGPSRRSSTFRSQVPEGVCARKCVE